MSNYSFKYSCGASMLASHIADGCDIAFANVCVTSDGRMLLLGMVRDTDIVITACAPLITENDRMLSSVYAHVRQEQNASCVAIEGGIAKEKYYSEDATSVHIVAAALGATSVYTVATSLGFDFDNAVALYVKQYPDARRMHDDEVRETFNMLCKEYGISRAVPTIPSYIAGVQVDELGTANSKELIAEFVQSVVTNALRDMFFVTVETPVMATMQMIAGKYKDEEAIEIAFRAILGICTELDLSGVEDEQGAIDSGVIILKNYGVNTDFLSHPTMNGAKDATGQLVTHALSKMEQGELFTVYACLKYSLDRAREQLEIQATGETLVELPNDTPMLGSFSLN